MSYYKQPYSFLAVFEDPQDAAIIDKAIENKELGYQKIGKLTYLGFFQEYPQTIHIDLKAKYKISGKIHWI